MTIKTFADIDFSKPVVFGISSKRTQYTATFSMPLRIVNVLNVREHWAKRAKRNASHRATTVMKLRSMPAWLPEPPLVVTLTRIAPRAFDTDGLAAAFKAVRDGIAEFYGVDDGPSGPIRWEYAQAKGKPKEYAVVVELKPVVRLGAT